MASHAFNELQPFIQSFVPPTNSLATIQLLSAPALLHVEQTGESLDMFKLEAKNADGEPLVDYKKLHEVVSKGPGIQKTRQLIEDYSDRALYSLNELTASEAVNALSNIVYAVRENQNQS
jgi:decaprenyl-diphosphate synthase subunit 2